jgi:hypothetical protein
MNFGAIACAVYRMTLVSRLPDCTFYPLQRVEGTVTCRTMVRDLVSHIMQFMNPTWVITLVTQLCTVGLELMVMIDGFQPHGPLAWLGIFARLASFCSLGTTLIKNAMAIQGLA